MISSLNFLCVSIKQKIFAVLVMNMSKKSIKTIKAGMFHTIILVLWNSVNLKKKTSLFFWQALPIISDHMVCVSILCHSQSWWSVKICNCFMKLNYGDMNNLSVEEAAKPPCQSLRCPGVAKRGRNHTCPSMRRGEKNLSTPPFPSQTAVIRPKGWEGKSTRDQDQVHMRGKMTAGGNWENSLKDLKDSRSDKCTGWSHQNGQFVCWRCIAKCKKSH